MSDFSAQSFCSLPTICPWSLESAGLAFSNLGGTPLATITDAVGYRAAMPANRALYVPFVLGQRITVVEMFTRNGDVVNGNVDLGIYNQEGRRLVSVGGAARAGASTYQVFDVADTVLGPGLFYMALVADGTGNFLCSAILADSVNNHCLGWQQQNNAYPLPDPATFALCTYQRMYVFGLSLRAGT